MKRILRFWNFSLQLALFIHSRGILSDVTWPNDTYGLPMPDKGCPNTPDVTWLTGWVLQDMEKESGYGHSKSFHLKCDLRDDIKRYFCMKTRTVNKGKILWPPGKYCIYRKGGSCPAHMRVGFFKWNDENFLNRNSQWGVYPDGDYSSDTLIHFCCRTDGDKNVPISLPTSKPFFLLAQGGSECQQVKWALATAEWLEYSTEGSGMRGPVYPYNGKLDDPKIYYCYYQSCNKTLNKDTGTVISPNHPGSIPRGQFCSWRIIVAPGYQVSLKFIEFSSSGNETEQLEVFDGANETSPIIDVFTGHNPPPAFGVNSTSNHMFIILRSAVKLVAGVNSGNFVAMFTKKEPSVIVTTTEAVTTLAVTTKNTNATVTENITYTEATLEPTKLSSRIPDHVTSEATEPPETEHSSGNISARSGANTRTGNGTLAAAVVVPLVIILVVVIGLVFFRKKRRNRRSSSKGVLRVMYDGNEKKTKTDIANPIYETEVKDNHCFNPIYDSGTEKEAANNTLQGHEDQNYEEIESDNPLYETAESNSNVKGQELRCETTYETDENALYSSVDDDNRDLQPDLEDKSLICAEHMNQDNVSDNPLYDASQPSPVVNPIYDL